MRNYKKRPGQITWEKERRGMECRLFAWLRIFQPTCSRSWLFLRLNHLLSFSCFFSLDHSSSLLLSTLIFRHDGQKFLSEQLDEMNELFKNIILFEVEVFIPVSQLYPHHILFCFLFCQCPLAKGHQVDTCHWTSWVYY